ncbi:MAG: hypothetical protein QM737_22780 [Ferruginibacter sp.]
MKTLLIVTAFVIVSCNSNSNSPIAPSYQDAKMTLKEKEEANPVQFIKAEGTYRRNLINQWVMEGKVTNTASVAVYKDVVIKFSFYSKTQTEIGSEQKVFYDYFKPNESKDFKVKSNGFDGTESVGFTVIKATSTNLP